MGAWAISSLGNDTALDWLLEFYESGGDVAVIRTALQRTLEPDDGLSGYPDFSALAAAEMIACRSGHPAPGKKYAELAEWVRGRFEVTPELVSLAREALGAIKTRWSRKEFWHGGRDAEAQSQWLAFITDLENRLHE